MGVWGRVRGNRAVRGRQSAVEGLLKGYRKRRCVAIRCDEALCGILE